jgi:hypothetical protein
MVKRALAITFGFCGAGRPLPFAGFQAKVVPLR